MKTVSLSVHVDRISHVFHLDGSVVPYLNFFPPISLPSGEVIQQFPYSQAAKESSPTIAPHDFIEITLYANHKPPLIKVIQESSSPRSNMDTDTCPVCHAPLFKGDYGYGRCLNRSCMGQITPTILLFLSALGLNFQLPHVKILEALLTRGALDSITRIFCLDIPDLLFYNVTTLEAQMFQQYIHSVRGSATVDQVLRGLRVPDWTDLTIQQVVTGFYQHNLSMKDLPVLTERGYWKEFPNIDWGGWEDFVSLPTNVSIIRDLATILHR